MDTNECKNSTGWVWG